MVRHILDCRILANVVLGTQCLFVWTVHISETHRSIVLGRDIVDVDIQLIVVVKRSLELKTTLYRPTSRKKSSHFPERMRGSNVVSVNSWRYDSRNWDPSHFFYQNMESHDTCTMQTRTRRKMRKGGTSPLSLFGSLSDGPSHVEIRTI